MFEWGVWVNMSGNRDWWCGMCKYKIYGSKDACSKCGSRRPGSGLPNGPVPAVIRPGDWACTGCGVNNFASRTTCFKCAKLRNDTVATTAVRECVVCLQPKLEIVFLPCGHMCTCATCAPRVEDCPMCRAAITEKKRVFVA